MSERRYEAPAVQDRREIVGLMTGPGMFSTCIANGHSVADCEYAETLPPGP